MCAFLWLVLYIHHFYIILLTKGEFNISRSSANESKWIFLSQQIRRYKGYKTSIQMVNNLKYKCDTKIDEHADQEITCWEAKCLMWCWMKHMLGSRLPGETSITSDMQMTQPLWQKAKEN